MLNILVITREIPPVGGGAGHVALSLAQTLERMGGSTIHTVTMAFGELPAFEKRGNISIYRINCLRRCQDSSYMREMMLFLAGAVTLGNRLMRSENIDLIHAHAIIPDGLAAVAVARGRVPVVATAHGSDVPGYNTDKFQIAHQALAPVWRWTTEKLDALTAPSRHLAGMIKKSKQDQEVHVLPNGIDAGMFAEGQLQRKNNDFLIVSRLVKRKNYHRFLEALKTIRQSQTVHIVGDGPMRGELEGLAAQQPQHNIVFHGWLENGSPEWKRLYEESRFFVFPSSSENFPINLLEAALARMVLILSDIPGNREVAGKEAVYLKALDADAVRETLQEVMNMPVKEHEMISNQARARVKEQFSWKKIAESYQDLYERLGISQRRRGAENGERPSGYIRTMPLKFWD